MMFDYGESPIKSIAPDGDGNTVYVGTGSGDLACFDMRTGLPGAHSFASYFGYGRELMICLWMHSSKYCSMQVKTSEVSREK